MTASALTRQVGGDHYRVMGIQPIQFCTVNRYDPAAFSVLKYVSRHRRKNGFEDLQKADHFIDLRLDLIREVPTVFAVNPAMDVITVQEYNATNNLTPTEGALLQELHVWARQADRTRSHAQAAAAIKAMLRSLSMFHYPANHKRET